MGNIASYKKIVLNEREILIFPSVEKLAEYAATWLFDLTASIPEGAVLNIALSGGTTPKKIFSIFLHSPQIKKNWVRSGFSGEMKDVYLPIMI